MSPKSRLEILSEQSGKLDRESVAYARLDRLFDEGSFVELDAFAKARNEKQARTIMLEAMRKDMENRFGGGEQLRLFVAHTNNAAAAEEFSAMLRQELGVDITYCDPLSLSVSCHIGPGALAVACSKKIDRYL